MLAMVQAIASQTLRAVPEREPVENFERRLIALSARARRAAAEELARRRPAQRRRPGSSRRSTAGERITRGGPAVTLGARAALSSSLLVHELMTNACKYGSLWSTAARSR